MDEPFPPTAQMYSIRANPRRQRVPVRCGRRYRNRPLAGGWPILRPADTVQIFLSGANYILSSYGESMAGSTTVQDLEREALKLTPLEQLQLVDRLIRYLIYNTTPRTASPVHSLRELKGMGKEIWAGIDAQAYVNKERDGWTG